MSELSKISSPRNRLDSTGIRLDTDLRTQFQVRHDRLHFESLSCPCDNRVMISILCEMYWFNSSWHLGRSQGETLLSITLCPSRDSCMTARESWTYTRSVRTDVTRSVNFLSSFLSLRLFNFLRYHVFFSLSDAVIQIKWLRKCILQYFIHDSVLGASSRSWLRIFLSMDSFLWNWYDTADP